MANAKVTVMPLVKETTGPRLAYRIAMGVRYADQGWKREAQSHHSGEPARHQQAAAELRRAATR
jgi:hypothetical protein